MLIKLYFFVTLESWVKQYFAEIKITFSFFSFVSLLRSQEYTVMSNVLVYSGPGESASALSHTLRSLRSLLPSYDVQCINAQSLAVDPWIQSTSLLVIPGGRDLPYVEQLSQFHKLSNATTSSRADARIRQYIEEHGGSFVGICAGAYYASSSCEFERGDQVMQVVGERPALQFYPGTCSGTAYPGFVYESDQGARLIDVAMEQQNEGAEQWTTYYNGGGAFINAEQFKQQGVEILGRYVSDRNASNASSDIQQHKLKSEYEGQAAIVYCKRGKGQAILYGTHPEFPVSVQERPTQETAAPEALPEKSQTGSVAATMQELEVKRLYQFGKHLQLLGLEVSLPDFPSIAPAQSEQPKLTPIVLVTRGTEQAQSIISSLQPVSVPLNRTATLAGSPESGLLVSVSDTNDTVHFYDYTNSATLAEICSRADYTPYMTPVVSQTSDEARAGQNSQPETQVDLQKVPKYFIISPSPVAVSDDRLFPHWNPQAFLGFLDSSRQIIETQIRERWVIETSSRGVWDDTSESVILADAHTYTCIVTSTQTMLDKNYKLLTRLPNGLTSFATHQISGRGRGKNAWISPLGCLQFSTLLHIPTPQKTFWHAGMGAIVFVQYLAGLAIVESVRSGALGKEYAEAIGNKIRIKWPNDVYAQVGEERKGTFTFQNKTYAKMAGVLVNSQFAGSDLALVVGCGINTLNARPTTSLSDLIEAYNHTHPDQTPLKIISQERFAGAILATFERMWNTFLRNGGSFVPFIEAYRRAWLHSDQETLLSDTVPPTRARIVGITSDHGLLRCVPVHADGTTSFGQINADSELAWGSSVSAGQFIDLQPDGNSFDMLQNLIRRKE